MPDLAAIVTRLVSIMRDVPTAGTVHDRLRSVNIQAPADYERLVQLVPDETDRWRGWFADAWLGPSRRKTAFDGQALEQGQVEVTIDVGLWWILPFDDASGSTAAHRQMEWDMAEKLRMKPSLDFGIGLVKHGEFQGRRPAAPIALSQGFGSGHLGEGSLQIRAIVAAGVC